jgi:L-ascorbate metabolism protein UlaG (beta-lactamase superfamily)
MKPPYKNLGRNHAPTAMELWRLMRTPKPKWSFRSSTQSFESPPTRVEGANLRVTFINHMTFLIQTQGKNLLTDPIWAQRCSPSQWVGSQRFAPPGLPLESLPPIDAILISHDHYDHLCLPTLKRISSAHDPEVFTGKGVGRTVRKSGLKTVHELEWWERAEWFDNGFIQACPAQHFSGRTPFDRNRTLWLSFWIQTPDVRLYFAGDTGMGPHFGLIHERLGAPDVSLLPIGAYKPLWFMSPVHMSPEEAIESHDILHSKESIATHFGTFALAMDGQDEPEQVLLEKKADRKFHTLKHGEWLQWPAPPVPE